MSHLDTFSPSILTVSEGEYWIVTVRGKQITPGAMVVLPREPYPHFQDVPSAAAIELIEVLAKLESLALTNLGADRVNVVAAMMKDPFVHFHFFPRYSNKVTIAGENWVDSDWPRAIVIRDVETNQTTLTAIHSLILNLLNE